jgi:two-component system LytT family response regulator
MQRAPMWVWIVGSWLIVAAIAACLFTAQMVFAGRTPRLSTIAEGLLIIPMWMALTPIVLLMSERAPITRESWPRRLPQYIALWLAFFVVSNILVRLPFAELREHFFTKLAFGLSVFLPGSALAFAVLVAIAHHVARRPTVEPSTDLRLRDGAKTFVVTFDDIEWIEAEDNYVLVHTTARSYTARQRMRDVESQLDKDVFVRVHRSAIVNVRRVAEVRPLTHGDFEVVLRAGVAVRGSRSRRSALDVMRGRYSAAK